MEEKKDQREKLDKERKDSLPEYEPPRVVTYSGDELLTELGPVQACSPFGVI